MTLARRLTLNGTMVLLLFAAGAGGQARPSGPGPASESAGTGANPRQAYSLPPEEMARAATLNKIRVGLDIGGSIWELVLLWVLLGSGAATRLDVWTRERVKWRWLQGAVFFASVVVILTLADLPLSAAGHAANLRYGISVESWIPWLGDSGKLLGVSLLIGVPLALLFNWIVRRSPRRYWIWIWLVTIPIGVTAVFLAPLALDPVFNRFSPLELTHPALVAKLEEVVSRTGTRIPPSRMFLMKASEKSNGVNAYVTGLGSSKRFVMWDTTMDRMPDDEIMFIFGHESGHYVLNHIPQMLAMTIGGLFFVFWGCAQMAETMVRSRGERWRVTAVASRPGFVVLFFAFSLAGLVLTPAANAISRHFEHEADVYGQEAIHGLVADPQRTAVSSFNHMGEAWLDDPNPNAFVEFWSYSHPSVQHRAEFAAHYDPWAHGGQGRFFGK